jgi:hypothetical protein
MPIFKNKIAFRGLVSCLPALLSSNVSDLNYYKNSENIQKRAIILLIIVNVGK